MLRYQMALTFFRGIEKNRNSSHFFDENRPVLLRKKQELLNEQKTIIFSKASGFMVELKCFLICISI